MGQEHSQNVGPALLDYQTHPRPHIWECPHHRALPYKRIPFTTMMTPMSYLWDGIWTDHKGRIMKTQIFHHAKIYIILQKNPVKETKIIQDIRTL
jgi:hypothetical protein